MNDLYHYIGTGIKVFAQEKDINDLLEIHGLHDDYHCVNNSFIVFNRINEYSLTISYKYTRFIEIPERPPESYMEDILEVLKEEGISYEIVYGIIDYYG